MFVCVQSAQLTQIVNSLMPSLCASPSSSPMSKGPCNHWRGQQKTAYSGWEANKHLQAHQQAKINLKYLTVSFI